MSKKKIEKMQKEYTKPQMTRWERQSRIQHITLIIGIIVIVAVVAVIGTGYYLEQWKPLNTTILTVNSRDFTMTDYLRVLRSLAKQQPAYVSSYAEYVLPYMEQSEILRQGSDKINISVTDAEVNASLKEAKLDKGYFPIERAELLSKKLVEGYFTNQVPATASQADIQAIFVESSTAATSVIAQVNAGKDLAELSTSDSLDYYTKNNKGDAGMHPQAVFPVILGSSVPSDFAFAADTQTGMLSQPLEDAAKEKPVGYWLIYVIEQGTGDNEGQTNFRVMLLGSEEEARSIKAELDAINDTTQKNDKFTEIAKTKSQYTNAASNGGLLGMTAKGIMGDAFDAVAFNLDVGTVSEPVKDTAQTTKGGYWVAKVTEKAAEKDLTADDISRLAQQKYSEWFGIEQANANVTTNFSDDAKTWAIQRISKELGL